MGTGAVPDVMLARSAGLELGETGGVACSSTLATSAAGVWAAGDICEYDSVLHGRRVRIEHWEVARAQGKAVAAAVAGPAGRLRRGAVLLVGPRRLGDARVRRRRRPRGTARSCAARSTTARSPSSTSRASGSWPRCRVGRPEDLMHARRLLAAGGELGGRADALADLGADLSAL